MGELAASNQLPLRGPDVLAMVQKEKETFAKKCRIYEETGALDKTVDHHVETTKRLALFRLAAENANVYQGFEAVLGLAEIWQDEMLWECCVAVEQKNAHAAAAAAVQSLSPQSPEAKAAFKKSGWGPRRRAMCYHAPAARPDLKDRSRRCV